MKRFNEFLIESLLSEADILVQSGEWWHGDKNQRNWFGDQKMDRDPGGQEAANESGPGIYFTKRRQEAQSYAAPDGYVYKVSIHPKQKILTDKIPASIKQITNLITWADPEDLESYLSNWDEDPTTALKKAISNTYQHSSSLIDAAFTLSNDLYRNKPNDWVTSMKSLGYDAYFNRKRDHLIVYDPSIITIESETPYSESEEV